MFKTSFPFEPILRNHLLIGLGIAVWVFVFLYFTEPLDVNEFNATEKLLFLPLYGLVGALAYLLVLPFQVWLYRKNEKFWSLKSEFFFICFFLSIGLILSRSIYLYIIVPNEPNPYTLSYYTKSIYLPAIATILPIILIGRWAFGKFRENKLSTKKIEIEGEGTYEGLRLHLNDLVAIKADDNYIAVSFLDNNKLKKQLIRNKLSTIAMEHPDLLRTHRSYLINPYHFVQWKMNSGKLHAVLTSEIEVPVSKTYADDTKAVLGQQ